MRSFGDRSNGVITITYDEIVPKGLSEFGTVWAAMLLHIVISDYTVKGSMFIASVCSSGYREQCRGKNKNNKD